MKKSENNFPYFDTIFAIVGSIKINKVDVDINCEQWQHISCFCPPLKYKNATYSINREYNRISTIHKEFQRM